MWPESPPLSKDLVVEAVKRYRPERDPSFMYGAKADELKDGELLFLLACRLDSHV